MRKNVYKRIAGILLVLVVVLGMIPAPTLKVHAGHVCPDCEEWIDGSPYCDECYRCDECIELCLECGKCTDCTGSEICSGCSDEESGNMCKECTIDKGSHCPGCDACYFGVGVWCDECGMCEDCSPYDEGCSNNLGEGILCVECAADKGSHCSGCGACYFETGVWCDECGLCEDCSPYDEGCSNYHGQVICMECAAEKGTHCPDCSTCYFEVGSWCEECGKCEDCSPSCLYCCEEAGAVICGDCAIDGGLHCTECSECYGECGGEYCIECGVCANCAEICSTEELCIECGISNGYHCPNCEGCGDTAVLCEGCGERCIDCSDDFCENCNLCSECVLLCQGCDSCAECAVICPNCEEFCSECEGLCDDCEFCLVCCADIAGFAGCDCGEWVCVESNNWEEHFNENHTETDENHSARSLPTWSWDDTYHWHACVYCENQSHYTNMNKHTYSANGKCTACYYVKDAKIQIIVQPKDVKYVCVSSANEDYDESNIAHFSVKAIGNSDLTYTWCRRYYSNGQLTYKPLSNPGELEKYDGPDLSVLVPTDACYNEYYICCIITDEDGNEVKTVDVLLKAKHDYHYFKRWRTHEYPYELAERNKYGHILQCGGEGCEKVTNLRPHVEENNDGYCDICDYEIGKILVTKQPKNVKNVYVRSAIEDYDESNIAHFSVEAVGESALTYTWCRKQYVNGELTYVPLSNPLEGESYDGPDLYLLVPTDACCNEYTYACIITDEEGNETRTVDVVLYAKHNYQYYQQYQTHENPYPTARRRYIGHKLQCVGEGCEKVTRYRPHTDTNNDYFCDVCDSKKDIMVVAIEVTAPKDGALPSYAVSTDSIAYHAMGDSSNYTQYRFWLESDNGIDNWKMIDKTTPFVAGKYYKFIVEMQTKQAYEFPVYTHSNGETELNFWAKVNGDYAYAQTTYGMDPTRYITISYEFGICNDSVIENITIENVTQPIAGEKPSYYATVRGSGYYIDVNYTRYEDDNMPWVIPENEREYYFVNGIGWVDVTDGAYDWLYSHETFIPGHEYKVCVRLKTEEGYTFYHDKELEMMFTASVNGFVAQGNTTTSFGLTEQTVSASFSCEGKNINTVMVNGLRVPRAGESPDYTVSMAYPEWYRLDPNYGGTGGVIWYNSEGNLMEPTDKFVEGERYKIEIKLIPAQLAGANTCQFVSPVSAYINGKQVIENEDWDAVYSSTNAVYIYYTFPNGALASTEGISVSGQVTGVNDDWGDITLQLIPQGLTEPAYETIVKGNITDYCFEDVAAGIYILRAFKANHVTYECSITVADKSVLQDVTLYLFGDINGDSKVNMADVVAIRRYLVNASKYPLNVEAAGDVTGDGKNNMADVVRIRRYLVNSEAYPLG